MDEYRREARVTQYQAGSTIVFPPTMQCVKVPDPEEGLKLSIDPAEVTEITGVTDNVVVSEETKPQISKRKRKKEE